MTAAVSPEAFDGMLEFFDTRYRDDIGELLNGYPNDTRSLWVDYGEVFRWNPDVADDLRNDPETIRETFEEALDEYDKPVDVDLSEANVRFYNVGEAKQLDGLRKGDIDKLRTISCQVSKASAVRPVVREAAWECQRCGTLTFLTINETMQTPHECQGCERKGPFQLNIGHSDVENHQLLRLKQPPEEETNNAQIGNELDAHVIGDLAGDVQAGERADVTGVLRVVSDDDDPTLGFYLDAWSVRSKNDGYEEVNASKHIDRLEEIAEDNPFATLAGSIAPGISGGEEIDIGTPWGETYGKYWWIRLAAGVSTLFGGWRRPNGEGTHHRGSSHMLLIGDPSTGKSTIMGAIESISPRSTAESGRNASGPGLTAAAVRDDFGDSEWSLEAGALVKAHNGAACIDEIDKMQKDGLSRLHSALEKQRLEINKAGIDATLKCETSLLAAGNPSESRFNNYDIDHAQIDIVGSLLDRFDLVFTLKDTPEESRDRRLAESVIQQRAESGLVATNRIEEDDRESADAAVDGDVLRAWVAYARENYAPVLTDEDAKERLKEYYVSVRSQNAVNGGEEHEPVPATVRTLDGLLRLSEACARLRLSDEVEPIDVEMAIALTKISLEDVGYDPETGKMDVDYKDGNTSHSQRERKARVRGVIETLQGSGNDGVSADAICEALSDMERETVEYELEKLSNGGAIYEPAVGEYRVT